MFYIAYIFHFRYQRDHRRYRPIHHDRTVCRLSRQGRTANPPPAVRLRDGVVPWCPRVLFLHDGGRERCFQHILPAAAVRHIFHRHVQFRLRAYSLDDGW